jgi:glycosyltransferase involved in cell wall biosynthesis
MKILVAHNFYQQPGGEDAVVHAETGLLRRHGHTVSTYLRSNAEITTDGFLSRWGLGLNTIWSHRSYREVIALIKSEKPDVAHFHNTLPLISPAAYWACSEAGVPVVQTLHNYRLLCPVATFYRDGHICEECMHHSLIPGIRYGCYRNSRAATAAVSAMLNFHRWKGTWTEKIDIYIALTEFSRNKFIEAGWPADNILVKPNFVHPDPGVCDERRNYALFVGRFSHEKGIRTLLQAWEKLNRIPLKMVGDGPLAEEVHQARRGHQLKGVEIVGRRSRDEVFELMKGARFLVFPSEWYETFGMTIGEAFACGLPVLASRLGAITEIVEGGRTGIHFTPGDPEDLAVKVEWAWTHEKEMQEMGKEARREYEMKYTAERNYTMLMDIYRLAIERVRKRYGASAGRN